MDTGPHGRERGPALTSPPIRVSTPHRSYPQERLIFVDHGGEVDVGRELDAVAFAYSSQYRLTHRVTWFYNFHTTPPFSRTDVFHLFNGCSMSRRPWVTTPESAFSFAGMGPLDGFGYLARPQCKRIMGLSGWAVAELERAVAGRDDGDAIMDKAIVLPPPQAIVPRDEEAGDGRIRLFFVGRDFFRKGGFEVLQAFDRVYPAHPALHLEIVSALVPGRFPAWWSTPPEELAEARRLIHEHPEGITWHESLPNAECLKRMSAAHVGLLPTFSDTYGYSVLELMAAGCPVIATNQRALGETVTDDRGWVVELPLADDATIRPRDPAQAAEYCRRVVDRLAAVFESIAERPDQIAPRAERAVEYIRANHDPAGYAGRLREIYRDALGS